MPSLKYAVVERERRYLIGRMPAGLTNPRTIADRYITGTRLRLREVREEDGAVTRKLCQKVRLTDGPAEVACTNLYLDDQEWETLIGLPARVLTKQRYLVHRDGVTVAIDRYDDGTLIAEIDDGDAPAGLLPEWLDVVRDVSTDERWTGAGLAH